MQLHSFSGRALRSSHTHQLLCCGEIGTVTWQLTTHWSGRKEAVQLVLLLSEPVVTVVTVAVVSRDFFLVRPLDHTSQGGVDHSFRPLVQFTVQLSPAISGHRDRTLGCRRCCRFTPLRPPRPRRARRPPQRVVAEMDKTVRVTQSALT